jgi:hypothetical protein
MPGTLTIQDFLPHVGRRIVPAGQHRVLTLVSATVSRFPGWESMPREPFALIMQGPPGDVLPEGLYDAAIEGGPDVTLHISPIHTPAPDRQDYQAVFN